MELKITGPQGSRTCTWNSYALVRDNVQHFAEQGIPSERFAALHELESAVDGETCVVPAVALRKQVLEARRVLRDLRLAQAAVSLRTRAIMTNCPDKPGVRGTLLARRTGWELPVREHGSVGVCEAARSFFDAVSAVTADGTAADVVSVALEGGRPRFASARRG